MTCVALYLFVARYLHDNMPSLSLDRSFFLVIESASISPAQKMNHNVTVHVYFLLPCYAHKRSRGKVMFSQVGHLVVATETEAHTVSKWAVRILLKRCLVCVVSSDSPYVTRLTNFRDMGNIANQL